MEANLIITKLQYLTICEEKNPGYQINLLLFLNKSQNWIPYSLIKLPNKIQYKNFVPIYPYLISEGDEIVRACDRHWDETVTLTKHVTKYKCMRKWIVKFLSKSLLLKLLESTQFAWPNLSNYFNFLCAIPRYDVIESTRFLMRPPVIIPPW